MDQDLFDDDIYDDIDPPVTNEEIKDLLLPTYPPKLKLDMVQEVLLSTFDHELERNNQKK